ncbi:MAG: hypothetical protein Q8P04_01865 [bacterium]|nr:hypothetical protein [bacterium]
MMTPKNTIRYFLPLLILTASIVLSYTLIAQAQTDSASSPQAEPTDEEIATKGISFPIPELGNCGSKNECRAYCNEPVNISACIKFAQDHDLMNKEEATRAEKFREKLQGGGGPGGCNSPESCKTFCGDPNNFETCVKFAEELGFKHEKSEKARKFVELVRQGETPGGCKSKEQCESYCQSETNKEECIAFGQKMGFIDERRAELFRKTGGKGPGDCNSEESCRAYCNDPGNQEACFKFAEEHGLIDKEKIQHAKEGFVRLRQGLENAPPEVAQCLKSVLGPNIIQDIQSGNLTPGPQIGERVRGCFEKFGRQGDAREGFNQAPPEITACVKEKLGDVFEKIRSGEVMPTPEMADAFRICGEKLRFLQGPPGEEGREGGREGGGPDIGNFLRSAPPGISSCLKEKLGDDFERAKLEGTPPGQEVKATLRECFESFKPERPEPREFNPSDFEGREGVKPANLREFRDFIRHEDSSTPPGLNRETFEKFRHEGGFRPGEGSSPPEGFNQQYQQQLQQYPSQPEPTPAPAPEGDILKAVRNLFGF